MGTVAVQCRIAAERKVWRLNSMQQWPEETCKPPQANLEEIMARRRKKQVMKEIVPEERTLGMDRNAV